MKKYIDTGKKDTRSGFGVGLLEAGRADSRVVALTADLKGSLKMDAFAAEFPLLHRCRYSLLVSGSHRTTI